MNRRTYITATSYVTIPAVKLIIRKECASTTTAVHIGWVDKEGVPFCLCGHEVGIKKNTKGRWTNAPVEDFPKITCKRCLKIWISNRIRQEDSAAPRVLVFNGLKREHLVGIPSIGKYTGGERFPHPSSEEYLNAVYGPHRFERKTQSGTILPGIIEAINATPISGEYVTNHRVHLATYDHRIGALVPSCSGVYCGRPTQDTPHDNNVHPYITCPHCIDIIKKNDLDASEETMAERRLELDEIQDHINWLNTRLYEVINKYNALAKQTLAKANKGE